MSSCHTLTNAMKLGEKINYLRRMVSYLIVTLCDLQPLRAYACTFIRKITNGTPSRPPHFHALHAEYEALIDIRTLEVLEGDLPPKLVKRVVEWAKGKQEVLLNEFIRLQRS